MQKKAPSVWMCAVLLVIALVWRILGAPMNAEALANLKTPIWQAGVLLPARAARVWLNWFDYTRMQPVTMEQEAGFGAETEAEPVWLNVYVDEQASMMKMTLQGYVCGVIAQEMPAAYHIEALKAQAVAARTRVIAQMQSGGCSRHPGADICTDSAHCQGYASLEQCRKKWRDSYEIYRDRILAAEKDTSGQLLMYNDQPITVFYHAISGGRTEDAQTVFSESIPYLISVESPGEEKVRGFSTDTLIEYETAAEKLSQYIGKQITAQELRRTLSIASYTDTGRVELVQVGDMTVSASVLREALNLRSTWFSVLMDERGICFAQKGYGHGVGMSQAGANIMASNGASYDEILMHYYTGVSIEQE